MAPYNFPAQPTPFIGREAELAEIARLLADPVCRLLTIVGPGGMGKTRLAIEAAQAAQMPDGVFFIPLQSLTAPEFMVHSIAAVLGMQFYQADDPKPQLLSYLQNKSILLVLDNFEHLLESSPLISEILTTAPAIKILTTSRERLNLQEEWAYPLGGLSVPGDGAAAETFSAVRLFVQRARQVQPTFTLNDNVDAVTTICQQVEGLPLGLELAASWLRAMSCTQIATYMQGNLNFLTTTVRNIPERHRSLTNVFEQSWLMLSGDEQAVLMRLSVFRGGFDLEAAEQVAGATLPLLASLVDKSLIRLNDTGRYNLHEMLRQFATEKLLKTGQNEATIEACCGYYLKLAEQVEAHNFGHEQVAWYDRAEQEWDNFRTALTWLTEDERGMQMAVALGWFLTERGHWREGLEWLEQMLLANPNAAVSLRAKALHFTASLAGHLVDFERVTTYCDRVIELEALIDDVRILAWAKSHLGVYMSYNPEESAKLFDESLALFRQVGDVMGLTHNLVRRSWAALDQHDTYHAEKLLNEALTYASAAGDTIMLGWVNQTMGDLARRDYNKLGQARHYYETALAYFQKARFNNGIIRSVVNLASVAHETGNAEQGEKHFTDALNIIRGSELQHSASYWLILIIRMAGWAGIQGQFERAVTLAGAAHRIDGVWTDQRIGFLLDLQVIRDHMGEAAYSAAWEAGHAMTLLQQIETYVVNIKTTSDDSSSASPAHTAATDPLTTRELEIIRLMRDGFNSREIADKLVLSVSTIRWYLKQIYSKLDVHGRSEALARVRELKLLP